MCIYFTAAEHGHRSMRLFALLLTYPKAIGYCEDCVPVGSIYGSSYHCVQYDLMRHEVWQRHDQ